jgi:hypothetical protein
MGNLIESIMEIIITEVKPQVTEEGVETLVPKKNVTKIHQSSPE